MVPSYTLFCKRYFPCAPRYVDSDPFCKDIPCGILITIMHCSALRTDPLPHFQIFYTRVLVSTLMADL